MKRRIGSWKLLDDIAEVLGPRRVTLGRELTKIHEEFLTGEASELREALAKRPSIKGRDHADDLERRGSGRGRDADRSGVR
jgi:16S rRNA C1402 (ribose-2'-O) methylase RsmI